MSKYEDYLEYEEAYRRLEEKIDYVNESCEKALTGVNEEMDYFSSQEKNLEKRIASIRARKKELERDSLVIRSQFDEEKRRIERDFDEENGVQYISISIGEFKDELANLIDVPKEEIDFQMEFECPIEAEGELDDPYDVAKIHFEEFNRKHRIQYDFDIPYAIRSDYGNKDCGGMLVLHKKLSDIEADGKTLLEHCTTHTYKHWTDSYLTKLVIDRDIDDIMISIYFKDLASNFHNQYGLLDNDIPILKQLLINHMEKQKSKTKSKIKK